MASSAPRSINSPVLLLASGIGPAGELAAQGIAFLGQRPPRTTIGTPPNRPNVPVSQDEIETTQGFS
jgi:hypothetical protein